SARAAPAVVPSVTTWAVAFGAIPPTLIGDSRDWGLLAFSEVEREVLPLHLRFEPRNTASASTTEESQALPGTWPRFAGRSRCPGSSGAPRFSGPNRGSWRPRSRPAA